MLVTTATTGARRRNEPSLSSASATSRSPAPSRVVEGAVSGAKTRPPITAVGSSPADESTWATSEVVVVLPWLPATAMPSFKRIDSASISALGLAELRVVGRDGRRVHDDVDGAQVLRGVADLHLDAERAQALERRGLA